MKKNGRASETTFDTVGIKVWRVG